MSSASHHVESDALGALRAELVAAGRRAAGRRRRRRRAATLLAAALALLALAAGAAAVAILGTGSSEVDQLLEIERRTPPVPGSATEPLEVRIGDGVYKTLAYLARDGSICIAQAEAHRGGVRGGFGGCPSLEDVARGVERRGVVWFGSSHGPDQRTFQGIIAGQVRAVRPLADGKWTALMTSAWTPDQPGAPPLKLLVVVDEAPLEAGPMGDLPRAAHLNPKLELTYADGRTRVAEGR